MASGLAPLFVLLALAWTGALAYDPSPLQDVCVADLIKSKYVNVNGYPCKDRKHVTIDDFTNNGPTHPPTPNKYGYCISPAGIYQIPAENTLGIYGSRVDYASGGIFPPHYDIRASELLSVIEGAIYTGFVLPGSPGYPPRNFATILKRGDSIVYPVAQIKYKMNIRRDRAVTLSVFNSQNPGLEYIGENTFGAQPEIEDRVLAKGFRISPKEVDILQKRFAHNF